MSLIEMTVTEVQEELARTEMRSRSLGAPILHETTPSAFLTAGLDIEESQYVIFLCIQYYADVLLRRKLSPLVKTTGNTSTAKQAAGVAEQRSVIQARLRVWEALRIVYMPGLLQYWQDIGEDPNRDVEAEEKALWLPSSLPASRRETICHVGLPDMELKLRAAQLADALNGVRHALRVKARMIQFKNKNICGQRSGTRSRAIIDGIHERAKSQAYRYRIAREARFSLEGEGEWCSVYRELKNDDVRSYQDPERAKAWAGRRGIEEDGIAVDDVGERDDGQDEMDIDLLPADRTPREGTGQTRRTLSWIWTTTVLPLDDNADPGDDILRTEWCRSRARANRATEEVNRLHEEMRRTLAFLKHQEQLWNRRKDARDVENIGLQEGLAAYAAKQAALQSKLGADFTRQWKEPLGTYMADSAGNNSSSGSDDDDDEDDDDDDDDGEGIYSNDVNEVDNGSVDIATGNALA